MRWLDEPAYFLTWRTYGTWLPGDPRGTTDRWHDHPGAAMAEPSARRLAFARARMGAPPVRLALAQRSVVDETIRAVCGYRQWPILALNVRSNHVHLVVFAVDVPPERVLLTVKAWTTRGLRESGVVADRRPVWSRGGSTRALATEGAVEAVVRYVLYGQDRPRPEATSVP